MCGAAIQLPGGAQRVEPGSAAEAEGLLAKNRAGASFSRERVRQVCEGRELPVEEHGSSLTRCTVTGEGVQIATYGDIEVIRERAELVMTDAPSTLHYKVHLEPQVKAFWKIVGLSFQRYAAAQKALGPSGERKRSGQMLAPI